MDDEIYLSLSYTILVVCCDAYIKVCGQVDLHFECFGQVESSIEWCLIRMHLKDTYIHCYSADGSFALDRRPVQYVRIYELPQQRMEMMDQERVVLMCALC